jgi:hypothetical protein
MSDCVCEGGVVLELLVRGCVQGRARLRRQRHLNSTETLRSASLDLTELNM